MIILFKNLTIDTEKVTSIYFEDQYIGFMFIGHEYHISCDIEDGKSIEIFKTISEFLKFDSSKILDFSEIIVERSGVTSWG